jgi:hypothetical protein
MEKSLQLAFAVHCHEPNCSAATSGRTTKWLPPAAPVKVHRLGERQVDQHIGVDDQNDPSSK